MKSIHLYNPAGLDTLTVKDSPEALPPGPDEIRIRLRASSINFHDFLVVTGAIKASEGRIPLSDGAGEVESVGSNVTEFKAGDQVVSVFLPLWVSGPPTDISTQFIPGDTIDGFAREMVTLPASAVTRAPAGFAPVESATLTCAGITAWSAVVVDGKLKAGETVLVQGTGGVSIFALQFAKMMGASVIATSSSNAKLEKLTSLGADHVINYRSDPEWGQTAKDWTDGLGVDHVIDVGGAQTITQSIKAVRRGGHIAIIGVLSGDLMPLSAVPFIQRKLRLQGVSCGSRVDQQDMIRAIEANGMHPVIDRTFPLEQLKQAFEYQESGAHLGKIAIEI